MDISQEQFKFIERLTTAHLYWAMGNKGLFLKPMNFSTVQYMAPATYRNGLKFNDLVVRSLMRLPNAAESRFLNVGATVGLLEWANRDWNDGVLNIDSLEWVEQFECLLAVRKLIGINIKHQCNDVNEDDFKIYDFVEEPYDYAIMERFFPLYMNIESEGFENILRKFAPYAKKAVIVESNNNWKPEVWGKLHEIAERRILVSSRDDGDPSLDWNAWVVDLGRYD